MRQLPISDEDVTRIVRLLGEVAGMTEPLPERRRTLMLGLAHIVEADVWMWVHSGGLDTGRPFGLAVIDGGWVHDSERNGVHQANFREDVTNSIATGLDFTRPTTWVYDRNHPGWGDGTVYETHVRPTGLTELMFCTHPLPKGLFSNIGLHRRAGRPPYTPREIAIAHLVLGQVDWLHYIDPPAIVLENGLAHLTARERQVLLHLLGGDARKQIAARMDLSEFTVGDYMKSLYRRLKVSSRGELMAKFLPSNQL